jgi:LPXTG-site transpeptidase (sortase) family protein
LYVLGAAMLFYVGLSYVRAYLAREKARSEWAAMEAQSAILAASAMLGQPSTRGAVATGSPVARLLIPRIGLDEVVVEGVNDPQLNAGPGHLPGTVFPGDEGNSVISAHRDRHFSDLDELAEGDTVITESIAGQPVVWIIRERKIVDRNAPALFDTAHPALTLTTCWPVRYVGPAPDRLILTATLAQPPGATT